MHSTSSSSANNYTSISSSAFDWQQFSYPGIELGTTSLDSFVAMGSRDVEIVDDVSENMVNDGEITRDRREGEAEGDSGVHMLANVVVQRSQQIPGPAAAATTPVPPIARLHLRKKRKRTSEMWDDMDLLEEEDGSEFVQCKWCKEKWPYSSKGPTTQFLRHCNTCKDKSFNLKQQVLETSVGAGPGSSSNLSGVAQIQYDEVKVRTVLAHLIMVHELPFKFVEYELFNYLMKTVAPQYKGISRNTARSDCMAAYEVEKKRMKNILKGVNRMGITTDLWKSGQKIQYMVVTGHFVDSDWKLQKRVMNFVDVPPPHSGLAISDALFKCFEKWGNVIYLSFLTSFCFNVSFLYN